MTEHAGIIPLFYQDFERDKFIKNDRYLKRLVRPLYAFVRHRPAVTGYLVWFQLLQKALIQSGYKVKVNDYGFAKKNPEIPVGLVGYPSLLENWTLPNPALLGPSLFSHPKEAPSLMDDERYKRYIVTCEWMKELFQPYYGDKLVMWHAGIDTQKWEDTRGQDKKIDVLIYDKIRWNRNQFVPDLLTPITEYLEGKGLRHHTIRYGHYEYHGYKNLLRESKSMIFLCEHETQGMAYQETLASNVPILAWDNGLWLDPDATHYEEPVRATSVPYFSAECGERFRTVEEFYPSFQRFWENLATYMPRRYVQQHLSFETSAAAYMRAYEELRSLAKS
jgi:glycosyltransferase involved in cell wall biosynthesis